MLQGYATELEDNNFKVDLNRIIEQALNEGLKILTSRGCSEEMKKEFQFFMNASLEELDLGERSSIGMLRSKNRNFIIYFSKC